MHRPPIEADRTSAISRHRQVVVGFQASLRCYTGLAISFCLSSESDWADKGVIKDSPGSVGFQASLIGLITML